MEILRARVPVKLPGLIAVEKVSHIETCPRREKDGGR